MPCSFKHPRRAPVISCPMLPISAALFLIPVPRGAWIQGRDFSFAFLGIWFYQLTQGLFTPTKLVRLSRSQNKFQGTCNPLGTKLFHQLLSVCFKKNPKDSRRSESRTWGEDWSSWTAVMWGEPASVRRYSRHAFRCHVPGPWGSAVNQDDKKTKFFVELACYGKRQTVKTVDDKISKW